MKFDWDPMKDRLNWIKHGVTFAEAKRIFDSSLTVYGAAAGVEGEERFIATGRYGDLILRVVFTERSGVIRIISARRTTRQEARIYEFRSDGKGRKR